MIDKDALAYVLVGAAIAIGAISLFVGVKRRGQDGNAPWSLRFLMSSKRAQLTHPTTLIVNGVVLLSGAVAAIIWL